MSSIIDCIILSIPHFVSFANSKSLSFGNWILCIALSLRCHISPSFIFNYSSRRSSLCMHHVCVNKLLFVFLLLISSVSLIYKAPRKPKRVEEKKLCFLLYIGFQYSDVLSNHNVYKTLSLWTSLLVNTRVFDNREYSCLENSMDWGAW